MLQQNLTDNEYDRTKTGQGRPEQSTIEQNRKEHNWMKKDRKK